MAWSEREHVRPDGPAPLHGFGKGGFRNIAAYLQRRSGDRGVAARFTRELDEKCRQIGATPFSTVGRARPELGPDLRSVAYKGYVIFLRQRDGTLEVVNILEGHRDMGDFYGEDW